MDNLQNIQNIQKRNNIYYAFFVQFSFIFEVRVYFCIWFCYMCLERCRIHSYPAKSNCLCSKRVSFNIAPYLSYVCPWSLRKHNSTPLECELISTRLCSCCVLDLWRGYTLPHNNTTQVPNREHCTLMSLIHMATRLLLAVDRHEAAVPQLAVHV